MRNLVSFIVGTVVGTAAGTAIGIFLAPNKKVIKEAALKKLTQIEAALEDAGSIKEEADE